MSTYPSHKTCNKCGQSKPLEDFYNHKGGKYGKKGLCTVCERQRTADWRSKNKAQHKQRQHSNYIKLKYDLSSEQYTTMLKEQQHCCYICGLDEIDCLHGRLYIDHDHASGKVRALLCHMCNSGLGYFKDNPELLESAKRYIQEYSRV